jgi:hypothetical protein
MYRCIKCCIEPYSSPLAVLRLSPLTEKAAYHLVTYYQVLGGRCVGPKCRKSSLHESNSSYLPSWGKGAPKLSNFLVHLILLDRNRLWRESGMSDVGRGRAHPYTQTAWMCAESSTLTIAGNEASE